MGDKIKDWPENLRPYEKVITNGASSLDDAELLAVVLKNGGKGKNSVELARELLLRAGGSLRGLHGLSFHELKKTDGIGDVKAITLLCVLELSVRLAKCTAPERTVFSSPSFIAEYFMEEMRHEKKEMLRVLYLDGRNGLILQKIMSVGSVNASMVPVREILMEAIRCDAVYMILMHNHPAGDPSPSDEDLNATIRMQNAGEETGIVLLDHIIIGDRRYFSFREEGLII